MTPPSEGEQKISDPNVRLSEENRAEADRIRERIGGDPRRVVLVVGTGVSFGMTNRHSLCSWTGLVEALAAELEVRDAGCSELESFKKLSNEKGLEKASATVIISVAHMIRDKLESLGAWGDVIGVISHTISTACDDTQPWSRFFAGMGERVRKRTDQPLDIPLILTTNYDTLLAERLGAFALTNPDHSPQPSWATKLTPKFNLTSPDGSTAPRPFLRRIVNARLLWTLHQSGRLEGRDAFVHHLHGCALHPSTVVFDAADYERVIQTGLWADVAKLWRTGGQHVVVFAGVGEGLFDRHFRLVWKQLALAREQHFGIDTDDGPIFYWLRESGDDLKGSEKLLREHSDAYPREVIRLISQADHGWYPHWIDSLFEEEFRFNWC